MSVVGIILNETTLFSSDRQYPFQPITKEKRANCTANCIPFHRPNLIDLEIVISNALSESVLRPLLAETRTLPYLSRRMERHFDKDFK
jgi:hypothetical protein